MWKKKFVIGLLVVITYITIFIVNKNDITVLAPYQKQITPWGMEIINSKPIIKKNNKKKVKIAILDSGIDKYHFELKGKIQAEFNVVNKSERIVDELGHGTAVAGIITANDNNSGLVGICQNVEIYSVKVLNNRGSATIEDIAEGINWSIEQEVDIINLSFGVSRDNVILEETINEAVNSGIVVVASAGNRYGEPAQFPAAYENVISVTAVDAESKIASFSASGKVDFAAPGVDIPVIAPNDKFAKLSGTSFATPHITGLIARLLLDTKLFNIDSKQDIYYQVYNFLRSHSIDLGDKGRDKLYGEGFVIIQ